MYSTVQKQTQSWGLQGEYKGFLRRIYHRDCAGRGYVWFGRKTGVLAGNKPSKDQIKSYESLLTSVVVGSNISVARNAYLDLALCRRRPSLFYMLTE